MKRMVLWFATVLLSTGATFAADPADKPDPREQLEAQVLYHPSAYVEGDIDTFLHDGGQRLAYRTTQGRQTAWLVTPPRPVKVQRLWVVAGGNAALALDMVPFCRESGLKSDAFVLVDYPGYGQCEGKPSPASIRENVRAATLAAADKTGVDIKHRPEQVCALGHSLGCAAALFAVEEFHLKSAVLCSPFTSSKEMAELLTGLPKDAPFKHQFDNRVGLKALLDDGGHAWIIHGSDDDIIPVSMSRTLSKEFPTVVRLQVIQDARHNDILSAGKREILRSMADAR
jgi:pimeloyl-ACP methyl ester carboxylesterase